MLFPSLDTTTFKKSWTKQLFKKVYQNNFLKKFIKTTF